MGGILSAPSAPPVYAPLPNETPAPSDDTQARIDELDRRRRGRAGTVLTSDRGLLRANETATQKKSLLGE